MLLHRIIFISFQNHSPVRHGLKCFQQVLHRPAGSVSHHRFRTCQRMKPETLENSVKTAVDFRCFQGSLYDPDPSQSHIIFNVGPQVLQEPLFRKLPVRKFRSLPGGAELNNVRDFACCDLRH